MSNPTTPVSPNPSENSKSPLQLLPAEIRTQIFTHALKEPQPLAICTDDCPPHYTQNDPNDGKIFYALHHPRSAMSTHYRKYGMKETIGPLGFWLLWIAKLEKRPAVPALALTCRQFFEEAVSIFFAENVFILSGPYSGDGEAWFEGLKRLRGVLEGMGFKEGDSEGESGRKRTMKIKHLRLHIPNCDDECMPETEEAGIVHITQDLLTQKLTVKFSGMLEGLCFCAIHDFASIVRGEDCMERFVRGFQKKWYVELRNFGRCGCLLKSDCERCGGREWETWEEHCRRIGREHWLEPVVPSAEEVRTVEEKVREMRHMDIRDYFVRAATE